MLLKEVRPRHTPFKLPLNANKLDVGRVIMISLLTQQQVPVLHAESGINVPFHV